MEESVTEASEEGTSSESTEESPTSEAGSAETQPQTEEWVRPGKFKTHDDVLRSYDHLEPEYYRTKNELARLKRELASNDKSGGDDREARVRKLAENLRNDPFEAIREVVRPELNSVLEEAKRAKLEASLIAARSNEEFRELEPVMANIVVNNSQLFDDYPGLRNDPRVLDALFFMAKGMNQNQATAAALREGKKAGEAAGVKKSRIQVESGSSSKGKSSTDFTGLSSSEMKKRILRGEA